MPLSSGEWDKYWDEKSGSENFGYDIVSSFYRKFIIRPAVNYFVQKHFKSGQNLLHAGCGSGQTDIDINTKFNVTAVDISPQALKLYCKFNKSNTRIIQGDILNVPVKDGKFDGVYNLGVMEHFSEEDIVRILHELKRIIKPDGKILLFWPPESGLSVRFLKILHVVLRKLLRRDVKLHPDEITLIKSRPHVESISAKAGLRIIDYYFGARDLFTQVAIVLKK